MIIDYTITGNQLVDGLILSQLLNIVVNNINYLIQLIYICITYIYNTIIGRLMISLYINEDTPLLVQYLDKYIENININNNIYGNNLIMIDQDNKQKDWFNRLLYIPITKTTSKDSDTLPSMTTKKIIIFNGKRIWLIKNMSIIKNLRYTTYSLMALNFRIDKNFFSDFFKEIESKYKSLNEVKNESVILQYRVYRTDRKKWWWMQTSGRTFDSVYVKDSIRIDLINDIEKFRNNKYFYDSHNIPYQRGYLFYGPPGTGKTSIVKVIGTKYKMQVYSIKLSDDYITDSTLESIILDNDATSGIYLFEDIDVLFNNDGAYHKKSKESKDESKDDKDEKEMKGSLTYTGFINILSGINNLFNNCFIVMTTNNIDRLPASLIRPGRIDKIYHIDYADANQLLLLTKSFYSNQSEGDYHLVVKMIMETYKDLTVALVQNFYINHIEFEDMIKSIDKLLER